MPNFKVLPICSLKGGVGKTTVAVGLAQALSRKGYRVGVLDADYHAPNIPIAMNCMARPRRGPDNTVLPPEVDGIKVLSWAMVWAEGSAIMVEDSQVDADDLLLVRAMVLEGKLEAAVKYLDQLIDHPGGAIEHMQMLMRPEAVAWGDIEWLVVDTPPESTGATRIVAEADGVTGAVIVSHPSRVSLADVRRTADLFRKQQLPLCGLVSNQGTDAGTGERRYDLPESVLVEYATSLGIPFLGAIPHATAEGALAGYFDHIAGSIIDVQPVVLPLKTIDVEAVDTIVRQARTFADLLEVFRGKR